MIGYVTPGTNDLPRSVAFYDALLGEIGATRHIESERFVAWAGDPAQPALGVIKRYDGKAATAGNGAMAAIVVDSSDKVDRLYAKAIELGAISEGPAGRGGTGFYAGYFRDLGGNKLNVFGMD